MRAGRRPGRHPNGEWSRGGGLQPERARVTRSDRALSHWCDRLGGGSAVRALPQRRRGGCPHMKLWKKPAPAAPKYPGIPTAVDGSAAVVSMETAASEAAGAYPITPSTQMGEGWAVAAAEGKTNVNGRRLLFFEPEGEHAAAAVTAGLSMVGLRATNFSSGQGIAYMHEDRK